MNNINKKLKAFTLKNLTLSKFGLYATAMGLSIYAGATIVGLHYLLSSGLVISGVSTLASWILPVCAWVILTAFVSTLGTCLSRSSAPAMASQVRYAPQTVACLFCLIAIASGFALPWFGVEIGSAFLSPVLINTSSLLASLSLGAVYAAGLSVGIGLLSGLLLSLYNVFTLSKDAALSINQYSQCF